MAATLNYYASSSGPVLFLTYAFFPFKIVILEAIQLWWA